jgi:hypothetical protein
MLESCIILSLNCFSIIIYYFYDLLDLGSAYFDEYWVPMSSRTVFISVALLICCAKFPDIQVLKRTANFLQLNDTESDTKATEHEL